MAKGRSPRKDPLKIKRVHATYLKIPNGGSDVGYKAGEVYGCNGHHVGTHQPCVSDMTEGTLSCPYCEAKLQQLWRGYVPIWDRDWTLRYALVGEDYLETVDVIPWREQVTLSRAKNPISPLVIRAERKLTRKLPNKEPWNEMIDMEGICLTLWKHTALTEWVLARRSKEATERPATVPVKSDGKPFTPPLVAAAKKWRKSDGAELLGDTPLKIGENLKKASESRNGSHAKQD